MKIIVGITGASGFVIGIRLLQILKNHETYLIISPNAKDILNLETDYSLEELEKLAYKMYDNSQMNVDIASGTNKFDALIIAPCSINTLSKIACGIEDNLITRVAAVALKEGRKLILVPRENPLSTVALKRMYELSSMGVKIVMPIPAFYLKPKTVSAVVDYTVGKVLDLLGIEHDLYEPYLP